MTVIRTLIWVSLISAKGNWYVLWMSFDFLKKIIFIFIYIYSHTSFYSYFFLLFSYRHLSSLSLHFIILITINNHNSALIYSFSQISYLLHDIRMYQTIKYSDSPTKIISYPNLIIFFFFFYFFFSSFFSFIF